MMSTFTLSLKLNTSVSDETILMERFYQGFLIYNLLVSHARKRLRASGRISGTGLLWTGI